MAIDQELLDILCCPKTKVDIQQLTSSDLNKLNSKIKLGKLKYSDGKPVDEPLKDGLITIDLETVYRVDDGIPVMLIDMGIPFAQVR